jgi:hypothetical protein
MWHFGTKLYRLHFDLSKKVIISNSNSRIIYIWNKQQQFDANAYSKTSALEKYPLKYFADSDDVE